MSDPLPAVARWSDMPKLLQDYEALSDRQDGKGRLFGYASLITNHDNEKPAGSHDIPNEKARLPGMEVAMNVLAAGENEFRGTRGTYRDASGKEKAFASVGVYAGLETAASPDGYAEGMNITTSRADRRESILAYVKRELGEPPKGIELADLFDPKAAAKFEALKGTEQDKFSMYKLHIVDVQTQTDNGVQTHPALTVSTNEESKFARLGMTPMQTAHLILDGHGFEQQDGKSVKGGAALDYFKKSALGVARTLGLNQPRLEAIDEAVEKLTRSYADISQSIAPAYKAKSWREFVRKVPGVFSDKKRTDQQAADYERMLERNPEFKGTYSPYFYPGENANNRNAPSDQDRAKPQNQMAHTGEEKLSRVAQLQAEGKTGRTR